MVQGRERERERERERVAGRNYLSFMAIRDAIHDIVCAHLISFWSPLSPLVIEVSILLAFLAGVSG